MLKAAIIGCGDIAGGYDEKSTDNGIYSHAGAYRACGVKIAAVFDVDVSRARAFAQYWGAGCVCEDLKALYAGSEYDLVSICVPDKMHHGIFTEFLHAGKTRIVWAEKPLASTSAEGAAMVALARKMRTGLRVTYQRRWEPLHVALAEEIRQGLIGDITAVHGYYVKGLVHIGTTMIDTIRFLVGEPESACSVSSIQKGSYPCDSSSDIALVYPGGVTAVIQGIDGSEYSYSLFEVDILGTRGRVRITGNGDCYEVSRVAAYDHYEGFSELKADRRGRTEMGASMQIGLEQMIRSLHEGTWTDVSDGDSALRNLELAEQGSSR
jgi:predicted dehydrogenase